MKYSLLMLFTFWGFSAAAEQASQPEITLSTTVTGNQEQPKVIYIIPWQAPIGTEALQIRLGASFMEENFEHLSPPVMQRQIAFKDQMRATESVAGGTE